MQGKLNTKQIDYLMYHLGHHVELNSDLRKRFSYEGQSAGACVVFPLSENELDRVLVIDDLPVLFPLSERTAFFELDEKGNLVFFHDLLKSAFYLLSGFQESRPFKGDANGRFSYADSLQKKYNFAGRPLVNEYFNIIIDGLQQFCTLHGLALRRKNIWGDADFGFMLTHDVDRVDKYNIHELKLKAKQVLGLSPSPLKRSATIGQFFKTAFNLAGNNNPYWNFSWMKKLEKKHGFNSTWFFLPRGVKHRDAYYSFSEKRIRDLVQELTGQGDEIGLHGTYGSRTDLAAMQKDYGAIRQLLQEKPGGARQHWLSFKYPQTLRLMEQVGLEYDTSWGFADHVGWRNSYCHPLRPYDIEQDRMMDIWELPLCVMDATLFEYQEMTFSRADEMIDNLLQRVIKHRGLFVLLWHNSYFEELVHPGISEFYQRLLGRIADRGGKSMLPQNILQVLTENE